jgi:hypothetical protein
MFQILDPPRILIAALLLVSSTAPTSAQTPRDQTSGTETGTELHALPPGPVDLNANVANPYANSPAPRKKPATLHNDESTNPYPAVVPTQRHNAPADPAGVTATRQSGLTDAQAKTILQQQGYTRIGDLQANPNSIWVWQADAIKNGQRVRLGIDYRGNLLELGSAASPCTGPQAGFGRPSPLGAGVRLSESSSCSGR